MTSPNKKKIGLVLSGGGAKGAYQAGVVTALAEHGVEVDAIAGSSIGALNGAVLSCAPSLREGARRLTELWHMIAESPPLEENDPVLLRVLNALGLRTDEFFRTTVILGKEMRRNFLSTALKPKESGLLGDDIIRRMLGGFVTDEGLANGLPLYVSVFPCRSPLETLFGCSLALLGIKDTPESDFLLVRSLGPEERRRALLASAAIPFLLRSQELRGELYSDGGTGGLLRAQGNTPVEPLLGAGCDVVIVTLLNDRSAWDESRYPGAAFVEIERRRSVNRARVIPDVLDVLYFHPDKIRSWIRQGHDDAVRTLRAHADKL